MRYSEIHKIKRLIREIEQKKIIDLETVFNIIDDMQFNGYIGFKETLSAQEYANNVEPIDAMWCFLDLIENHLKRSIDSDTAEFIIRELNKVNSKK